MEIEVKFPYRKGVERKVEEISEFVIQKTELDVYFKHPCRDFAKTDEALRIRRDAEGVTVTYKGPKLDKETKSREEVKVKAGDFESAKKIFEKLGFEAFAEVKKERRIYRAGDVLICLDYVYGLGKFVEIEVEADSLDAKEKVFKIAEQLGYRRDESIRESYLELILQKKSGKD